MCYGSAGTVCPSPPTPLQGSTGPTRSLCARDRAGPGTMCLVCGLLFLSMTRAGIFQLQGTQTQCYSLQRPGLGEGHGTPGTLGLSWCGCGLAGGIRTQCPNAVAQRARRSLCCLASGRHRGLAGNTTGHVSVSLVARKGLYARILPLKLRAVLCGLG